MKRKVTQYRFQADQIFDGELIVTYKHGFLFRIEGLKYIGAQWSNMGINKAIPFREKEIPKVVDAHEGTISFKKLRKRKTSEILLKEVA